MQLDIPGRLRVRASKETQIFIRSIARRSFPSVHLTNPGFGHPGTDFLSRQCGTPARRAPRPFRHLPQPDLYRRKIYTRESGNKRKGGKSDQV